MEDRYKTYATKSLWPSFGDLAFNESFNSYLSMIDPILGDGNTLFRYEPEEWKATGSDSNSVNLSTNRKHANLSFGD